ncbi:reverse transcriptase domain-containing protein [Tanacetum coccineum]
MADTELCSIAPSTHRGQRFDESFYEAWDRFNDLLRACPHHGFSELHQLDTFYNALNINDQDSLNSAAGGNFLDKMPRECLKIIEASPKFRQTRAKAVVAKFVTANTASTSGSEANTRGDKGPSAPILVHQSTAPVHLRDEFPRLAFTDATLFEAQFLLDSKTYLGIKKKLTEVARTSMNPVLARTSMNEHCSRSLDKLPRKRWRPRKFLIPCEFPVMDECLALADLGASINLMPFSSGKSFPLPDHTPNLHDTRNIADRSISKPMGIAKDNSVKVGVFHFPADFVVVDFEPDPRVPLILGSEASPYNLDQLFKYSANYTHMTANKIDVIDMACEEYSQEVLGFTDIIASGNSTPYYDPIVATSSPTLTPFGDSDFLLLEEADSFLGLADDPDCPSKKSKSKNPRCY